MIIFDIILLLTLSGFVFYGLFFGLVKTAGNLLGFFIGLWIAINFYLPVFDWIKSLFFGNIILGKIICFFVIYALANRLVVLGFGILNKIFNLLSIIPFLKTINRLGGAVLGFIEGGFLLGVILFTMTNNPILAKIFSPWLSNSEFSPFLIKFARSITPLIPQILKKLEHLI
jgi:membrane protein required for colicin V production